MSYGINRRLFLRSLGISAASSLFVELGCAENILASKFFINPVTSIKIFGVVRANGKGIKNVAVSDGVSVVATKSDGAFELVSNSSRPFIFCSIPSGYEIPTHTVGTAKFFAPIAADRKNEMNVAWELVSSKLNDTNHSFLQLADPQTLDAADMQRFHNETIPDIKNLIAENSSIPFFGVSCGDIMFDRLEFFPDYEQAIQKTSIPFFQVLGNHDVERLAQSDELAAASFMKYFGPTYYSFNRGDIHYIVMDDVLWHGNGYIGYIEQQQYDWLKADVSFVEKGKTVVVFMHIPPYNEFHLRNGGASASKSNILTNRSQLYEILKPYKARIIAGHMHESEHLVESGARIHIAGAVCGAWWTGDICQDGTPNGYAVYEASGENLRWYYKATGKTRDEQIRVYAHGANPEFPDEILANVWDADSEWKIAWYEDGIKKGLMTKRRAFDPLAYQSQLGNSQPKKHTWVEPAKADHIFFAAASKSAKEIIVEATDRFGRVYSKKL